MISIGSASHFATPASHALDDVLGLRGSRRITGAAPPESKFYENGAFDILVEMQFSGGTLTPAPMWSSPPKTGASQNFSRYCNREFDQPVAQIDAEADDAKPRQPFRHAMDLRVRMRVHRRRVHRALRAMEELRQGTGHPEADPLRVGAL